jgi:hypothetical protein
MHKSAMRSTVPAVFAVFPSNYQRAGSHMPRQSSAVGGSALAKTARGSAVFLLFPAVPNSDLRIAGDGIIVLSGSSGCLCNRMPGPHHRRQLLSI